MAPIDAQPGPGGGGSTGRWSPRRGARTWPHGRPQHRARNASLAQSAQDAPLREQPLAVAVHVRGVRERAAARVQRVEERGAHVVRCRWAGRGREPHADRRHLRGAERPGGQRRWCAETLVCFCVRICHLARMSQRICSAPIALLICTRGLISAEGAPACRRMLFSLSAACTDDVSEDAMPAARVDLRGCICIADRAASWGLSTCQNLRASYYT